MWVVKVGGSLARCASLGRWIDVLATEGAGRVVLVPGGGVFADAVREAQARWGFNDVTAHRMAVLAMEQTGLMLAGLRGDLVPAATPLELTDALDRRRVAVWMPSAMVSAASELPRSWSLTSDSLAAWLAGVLGARQLVLIKSAPLPEEPVACSALQAAGIVDELFGRLITGQAFSTRAANDSHLASCRDALQGGRALGVAVIPGRRPRHVM